jgi:Spy/CpxP family protein refolding chaperone
VSWRLALGLALVWGLMAPGASGQESTPSRSRERRDEAFRMVDAYVIANIQDSLDLDDDQHTRVIPLVNKLQKTRREHHAERGRALRKMRRLLRSGTATEAEVEEALQASNAIEAEGPERIRAQLSALDAVLTPLQQAKYRVFELEVEQRMRELMRRGRRERSPEGQPRP